LASNSGTSRLPQHSHRRSGWRSISVLLVSASLLRRRGKSWLSPLRAGQDTSAPGGGSGKWKWLTFWSCFFGYAVCYFTRQSLSYTAPVLRKAMGWQGLTELGQLSSLFPLAYGSSRFLGGVLGDLMSPKQVFALGLGVCSFLNIAFGFSSTLPQFAFFLVSEWLLPGPGCTAMR
jgi:hypothetical protein